MVTIKTPRIELRGDKSRLSADIVINGQTSTLWFEVEEKYGQYLCFERGDAFVLAMLYWCMRKGHDIVSEAPMTRRLYDQLTDQFLSPFYRLNDMSSVEGVTGERGHAVRITCPVDSEVAHPDGGNRIGTGISCGVDSLHVFAAHADVNCACIWNAHVTTGIAEMDSAEGQQRAWVDQLKLAEGFCADAGMELIACNTNFDRKCISDLQWDGMTTYGNLFCIFALQKLWSKYYVASGYDISNQHMRFPDINTDPAHYEYFLFPHLALRSFSVLLDGQSHNRVEKVRDLIDYPLAKRWLNVCHRINEGHRNGTHDCPKCMRTLLDLEVWHAVDDFGHVFDIDYYHTHFKEFLAEYYRGLLQKDAFALEMRPYFKDRHFGTRDVFGACRIVAKKIMLKILRLGRVSTSFNSR